MSKSVAMVTAPELFPDSKIQSFLQMCTNKHVFWSSPLNSAGTSLFQASQAWRKNKMDESKHEIHSQVDAITAGTASMVNLTAGRTGLLAVVLSLQL